MPQLVNYHIILRNIAMGPGLSLITSLFLSRMLIIVFYCFIRTIILGKRMIWINLVYDLVLLKVYSFAYEFFHNTFLESERL